MTSVRRSAFQLMSLLDLLMLIVFAQLGGSRLAVEQAERERDAAVAARGQAISAEQAAQASRDAAETDRNAIAAEATAMGVELAATADRLRSQRTALEQARRDAAAATQLAQQRQERLATIAATFGQSAGQTERATRELAELQNLVERWWVELDDGGRPTLRIDGRRYPLAPFRASPTEEADARGDVSPSERSRLGGEQAAQAAAAFQSQLEQFARGSVRPMRDTLLLLGWTEQTPPHWTEPAWLAVRRAAEGIETTQNDGRVGRRIDVVPVQVGVLSPQPP